MTEQRVAEVFVELADTLVDDFDTMDFLQSLTERCVELLGVGDAGLMLADEDGRLGLVASTSKTTRDLELFELQSKQGPCLDTFASGMPFHNVDLRTADQRWPDFSRAALAIGVRSTTALPLRLRGQVIGALNLFSEREALSATNLALGQAMADVATIGLLNERSLRERLLLTEQLQGALDSRVVIEQAKGILAARAGVSVAEAFLALRRHARSTGTSLTGTADAVVRGVLQLNVGEAPPQQPPRQLQQPPTIAANVEVSPGDGGIEASIQLTALDRSILQMVSFGLAIAVVAERLQIPLPDMGQHLKDIRVQFGVHNTQAAVRAARQRGLI